MCFFHVCHPLKGPLPFICLLRPKWATYQRDGDGLRTFFKTSDAWSCLTSRILIERNSWNNSSRQSSLLPKLGTAICQLFAFHSSFGNDVPLGCKGLELLGGTSTGQNLVKNADAENQYYLMCNMNFWANNFTCNHSLLSPQICCSTTSAVPEPNSIKKNHQCSKFPSSNSGIPLETSTNRLNWHHRKPRFWRRCWIWMAYRRPVGSKRRFITHLESDFGCFGRFEFHHNFSSAKLCLPFFLGFKQKSGLHKFLSQNSSEPNFSNVSDPSIKFKLSFCRPWSARILAHLSVARNLTWPAAGCLGGGCWWHETCGFSGGLLQPQKNDTRGFSESF